MSMKRWQKQRKHYDPRLHHLLDKLLKMMDDPGFISGNTQIGVMEREASRVESLGVDY